jgi:hypothetical protein
MYNVYLIVIENNKQNYNNWPHKLRSNDVQAIRLILQQSQSMSNKFYIHELLRVLATCGDAATCGDVATTYLSPSMRNGGNKMSSTKERGSEEDAFDFN